MRRVTQTAAGVVLFRNGGEARRYLLMRSALTRRPIWEFPKGGVEPGETESQAAVRELWEEAGIGESQISLFVAIARRSATSLPRVRARSAR